MKYSVSGETKAVPMSAPEGNLTSLTQRTDRRRSASVFLTVSVIKRHPALRHNDS